jgi:hypothetical protein
MAQRMPALGGHSRLCTEILHVPPRATRGPVREHPAILPPGQRLQGLPQRGAQRYHPLLATLPTSHHQVSPGRMDICPPEIGAFSRPQPGMRSQQD